MDEGAEVTKGKLCSCDLGSQAVVEARALVFGPHKGLCHSPRIGLQGPFSKSALRSHTS